MKPDRYEERLAEYLGGEMTPAEKEAFEEELRTAPEYREEAAALRAALADLRALPAGFAEPSRPGRGVVYRLVIGGLKSAAILAFGVFLGRFTATSTSKPTGTATTQHSPTLTQEGEYNASTQLATIHPGWIAIGRKLGANSGNIATQLGLPTAGWE
jgi:ferric-dicitrate binding protein FerR (iron transport regulator)